MDLGLSNKVALVTGASSGIGAATAQVLAQEGADVVVAYGQDQRGAEQTLQAVQSAGRRGWPVAMDLRDPKAIADAFAQLRVELEGLDLLILCAGHNVVTPLESISAAEWDSVLAINLSGPFFVVQAALPLLRDGGAIVAVASVAAHTGAPQHLHYAAAKAGLVNLTKSLARGLAPRIRVNCVAPGITLTPMGQQAIEALSPTYAEEKLLVQRFATPEEIARSIVFVASPAAAFMTGATIDINGGRDLR